MNRRILNVCALFAGLLGFAFAALGQSIPMPGPGMSHSSGSGIAFVREVQTFNVTTSTSTAITSLSNAIPAGDLALINWKQDTNNTTTATSVADNAGGNTWVCTTPNTADTNIALGFCYSFLATTLSTGSTVTITWANATFAYKVGDLVDIRGVTALDTAAANTTANFGTAVSAPITTSSPNTIVISQIGEDTAIVYTVGGSFTDYNNLTSSGGRRTDFCYRVVSSSGTYNPSGSYASNANWIGSTIAFH